MTIGELQDKLSGLVESGWSKDIDIVVLDPTSPDQNWLEIVAVESDDGGAFLVGA